MIYRFVRARGITARIYTIGPNRCPSLRTTRNALNCSNCPILCKRCSSYRAPRRYSSSLSLIHSPALLSCARSLVPLLPLPFSLSLTHSLTFSLARSFVATVSPFPSFCDRVTFTSSPSIAKSFRSSRVSLRVIANDSAASGKTTATPMIYGRRRRVCIQPVRMNIVSQGRFFTVHPSNAGGEASGFPVAVPAGFTTVSTSFRHRSP